LPRSSSHATPCWPVRVLLDENLPHDLIVEFGDQQVVTVQDLAAVPFGVVVIRARSNRVQDLRPLIGAISEALARVEPGKVVHVGS
jgi:hypothetical protein